MRISNGVEMLQINIEAFGNRAVFNPTLIWDEETAILIDTGMPGQMNQIREAMNAAGVSLDQLKAVILTHQDLDHIGSLPEILKDLNNPIEVYAHELDKPYIEGTIPLMKTDPSRIKAETWESLPEAMRSLYTNPPQAKINHTLSDGQELPYCGGIRVIHTPGHTPGHISLYLQESKTLVAGDALIIMDDKLRGPVQQNTPDMETAHDSLKKFLNLDIETVICYHGGVSRSKAYEQLNELVKQVHELK